MQCHIIRLLPVSIQHREYKICVAVALITARQLIIFGLDVLLLDFLFTKSSSVNMFASNGQIPQNWNPVTALSCVADLDKVFPKMFATS